MIVMMNLPADVVKLISSGVCYATIVIPLLVLIPDFKLIPHFPTLICTGAKKKRKKERKKARTKKKKNKKLNWYSPNSLDAE